MPNIWTIDEKDDKDEKESNDKKDDHADTKKSEKLFSNSSYSNHDDDDDEPVARIISGSGLDDDLEKPSFLRRLAKRRKDDDKTD